MIFEYYGDDWHGNPVVHLPNAKPHPRNNKTAKQLYDETMDREKLLISLGYKVVSIWQNDFPIRYDQRHERYKVVKFTNRHGFRIRARDRLKTQKQALWMRDMAHHVLPDGTFDV